jgi:hypothetical protein
MGADDKDKAQGSAAPAGKPRFVPARPATLKGISGEPPAWAVGVVAGSVGFILFIFALEHWVPGFVPFSGSTYFNVGLIVLPMVVLVVLMVGTKLFEFRQAQSWTAATGTVVRSQMETHRHRFQNEPETVEDVPAVEYEFTAGDRKVRGSRIGIGDDSGGANSDATLARYPLGASVTVYYDPHNPAHCTLERGGPKDLKAGGCIGGLVLLALAGGGIWWLIARGPAFLDARFPDANSPLVIFAGCFGLAALLFFVSAHRYSKKAQGWPAARGKVLKSAVESYLDHVGGAHGSATRFYRPTVEYSYQLRGRAYHSTQIRLGTTASGTQAYADKVAAKYAAGKEVDVHYDPLNPSTAALENPTGATWIYFAVAVFCLAVAVSQLGIFK